MECPHTYYKTVSVGVYRCAFCGKEKKKMDNENQTQNTDPEGYYAVKKSALDVQEGGGHYKDMKIQPVEFIHANNIPFLEANVIKYVCRHRNKNKAQDLKKARHYIDLLLQLQYGENK